MTPPTNLPPAVEIMRLLSLEPDPWQVEVLENRHARLLLNCCRQAGKSTVVAVLALVEALFHRLTKVLILSRSHRQAKELLRLITFFHQILGNRLLERRTAEEIEFKHLSRIVSLPCREDTIRGYAHVDLIIIDEAARVPDDLYRTVRPMLAVSKGRLICLSTPFGKRGFFYNAWARGGDDWARIHIPASQCPRIDPKFLDEERRALGDAWFRQEYHCSFESVEGLVYPDFDRCVVPALPENLRKIDEAWHKRIEDDAARLARSARVSDPARSARVSDPARSARVSDPADPWTAGLPSPRPPLSSILDPDCGIRLAGGMDFGFTNPFAAVWGLVDRDDVLWLTGEHYERYQPLSHHAVFLPRDVLWQADPSGATEIAGLRHANFKVLPAKNAVRPGIAAVTARLRQGTLRVLAGRCPNLLAEAGLYRWDPAGDKNTETPEPDHNHALDALRYLIMRLDARHLARPAAAAPPPAAAAG